MSGRIRVAIVGFGSVVKSELLPAMIACGRFEIAAVAEPRDVSVEMASRLPSTVEWRKDYREIEESKIDLVVVALPNHLHAEVACHFLIRGVRVFCEKPMAISVSEAESMMEASRRSGALLMVGHVLRFAKPVAFLKRLMDRGVLGEIEYFCCRQGTARPPCGESDFYSLRRFAGGGVVIDKGIHMLDLLELLCGPIVVRGARRIEVDGAERDLEAEVNIEFTLEGSSRPSYFTLSRSRRLENVLTLVCSEGNAHLDLADYRQLRLSCCLEPQGLDSIQVSFHGHNPFAVEMEHLADVIDKGIPCHSPGQVGLRALHQVEAIEDFLRRALA